MTQPQPAPASLPQPFRVLVVGAETGLGGQVIQQALDAGHQVTAIRAPGTTTPFDRSPDLQIREAAYKTAHLERHDLSGQGAVVFSYALPALSSFRRPARFASQVLGHFCRWLENAAAEGVSRVVMLGQADLFAPPSGDETTHERNPISSKGYGRAVGLIWKKWRTLCLSCGGVRVHPGALYGPQTGFAELVRRLKYKDHLPMAGDRSQWISPVHIQDAAQGVLLAAMQGQPDHDYLLAAEPVLQHDFIRMTLNYMGIKQELRAPSVFWQWVTRGRMETESRLLACRVRTDLAHQELGWSPKYATLDQGLPHALKDLGALAWS